MSSYDRGQRHNVILILTATTFLEIGKYLSLQDLCAGKWREAAKEKNFFLWPFPPFWQPPGEGRREENKVYLPSFTTLYLSLGSKSKAKGRGMFFCNATYIDVSEVLCHFLTVLKTAFQCLIRDFFVAFLKGWARLAEIQNRKKGKNGGGPKVFSPPLLLGRRERNFCPNPTYLSFSQNNREKETTFFAEAESRIFNSHFSALFGEEEERENSIVLLFPPGKPSPLPSSTGRWLKIQKQSPQAPHTTLLNACYAHWRRAARGGDRKKTRIYGLSSPFPLSSPFAMHYICIYFRNTPNSQTK